MRLLGLLVLLILACSHGASENTEATKSTDPYLLILGIAQDGGFPHAGCKQPACERAAVNPDEQRYVSSIAIVDPASRQRWLIDATPDFPEQLRMLDRLAPSSSPPPALDGIFLTHAHIGHYTGLMHLGREVLGAKKVAVHAMPRMKTFLESQAPWNQLVKLGNIEIRPMLDGQVIQLNERISVRPILVPHRDEYSETVGFIISGPARSALFIPDIDKWEKWNVRTEDLITSVDLALLDGTFFADGEIPGRSMTDIPHPFIVESLVRFASLSSEDRSKICFIHLNHTNPALLQGSAARKRIQAAGMRVPQQGERWGL